MYKISTIIAWVMLFTAVCAIIGGRIYYFVWHPEWTDAQAIRHLWLLYGLALCFLISALAVLREQK